MTKEELAQWAIANGWQMIGGCPSLTRRADPKDAVVRIVLKATVVHLEVKRPAGKWEKLAGHSYADVVADPETGVPLGLGFEQMPAFGTLMRENKDRMMLAGMAGQGDLIPIPFRIDSRGQGKRSFFEKKDRKAFSPRHSATACPQCSSIKIDWYESLRTSRSTTGSASEP